MRIGFILFLIFSSQNFIFAQSESFRASVDRSEVALDEYVQVEFILENAQGKGFTPPDFAEWTVISGPSTSTQVSIVNGLRSSAISYIYTLSPKKAGDLHIGKASIQANGKTLSSTALTIKAVKSKPAITKGKDEVAISKKDIFLMATATPEHAYVGQQILVEYKLYTAINVENYNISHAPEFKGFHVNNIPRLSYDNRESINGRTYVTKVIYAASIYPIQNGTFEIEPLHVRASVITDEANSNSFFLLPTTEGITLISNPVSLQVQSLPQPTPSNFSGAVGKFRMAAAIDQLAVKVNDAVSLTLYVDGDGDLNRVGKPFLQIDSTAFQLYEPKITKENVDYKNGGFIGMRELIYPLVATQPGAHTIIPSFIYFDTDSQQYVTIASDVYHVNVSGTATGNRSGVASSGTAGDDILPLIKDPKPGGSGWIGTSGYWGALALPYLLWLGVATRRYLRSKSDIKYGVQKYLEEVKNTALTELDTLPTSSSTSDSKAVLDQLNQILQSFLKTKWNIQKEALDKHDWEKYIDQSLVSDTIKSDIKLIFKEVEMAVFAGQMPKAQILELIKKAKAVIESV